MNTPIKETIGRYPSQQVINKVQLGLHPCQIMHRKDKTWDSRQSTNIIEVNCFF